MNDEVKEILENLDKIAKAEYYPEDLLTYKECQLLLDYITNLQEENEDLKDRLKVMKHFKNSLQEENEKLKKENTKLYKKDTKIINELKEELEITQEKWNKDKQWSECRTKEWLDYKSRCEKAIEFININKKEIERLNNIIGELENWLKEEADFWKQKQEEAIKNGWLEFGGKYNTTIIYENVINKLKELKEGDKNEEIKQEN